LKPPKKVATHSDQDCIFTPISASSNITTQLRPTQMPPISCFLLLTFLFTTSTLDVVVGAVGVNWGTMASHPLPPLKVVKLLKSNNINKVKLFDANSDVLQSLSGSNVAVTVGIPNAMLRSLNSSKKAADSWVHDNVTRYIPNGGSVTRIE